MNPDLLNKIKQLLSNGRLEEVFELFEKEVSQIDEKIFEDIIALKGKYYNSKEDFQVRNIIASSEFNLERSRTVNGIQLILRKLQSSSQGSQRNTSRKQVVLSSIFLILLAAGVYFWNQIESEKSNTAHAQKTLTAINHDFIGKWHAKVQKKGYLIDRGIRTTYENADAHWQVEIFKNNKITLSGTIDTSNAATYTWFYKEIDSILTLIQDDHLAFEIQILKHNKSYQHWTTTVKNGNKTEEWTWILTR